MVTSKMPGPVNLSAALTWLHASQTDVAKQLNAWKQLQRLSVDDWGLTYQPLRGAFVVLEHTRELPTRARRVVATDSCNAHTKLLLDDGSSCSLDDVMDVDFADMEEGMQHALVAELHQAVSTGALPAITREEASAAFIHMARIHQASGDVEELAALRALCEQADAANGLQHHPKPQDSCSLGPDWPHSVTGLLSLFNRLLWLGAHRTLLLVRDKPDDVEQEMLAEVFGDAGVGEGAPRCGGGGGEEEAQRGQGQLGKDGLEVAVSPPQPVQPMASEDGAYKAPVGKVQQQQQQQQGLHEGQGRESSPAVHVDSAACAPTCTAGDDRQRTEVSPVAVPSGPALSGGVGDAGVPAGQPQPQPQPQAQQQKPQKQQSARGGAGGAGTELQQAASGGCVRQLASSLDRMGSVTGESPVPSAVAKVSIVSASRAHGGAREAKQEAERAGERSRGKVSKGDKERGRDRDRERERTCERENDQGREQERERDREKRQGRNGEGRGALEQREQDWDLARERERRHGEKRRRGDEVHGEERQLPGQGEELSPGRQHGGKRHQGLTRQPERREKPPRDGGGWEDGGERVQERERGQGPDRSHASGPDKEEGAPVRPEAHRSRRDGSMAPAAAVPLQPLRPPEAVLSLLWHQPGHPPPLPRIHHDAERHLNKQELQQLVDYIASTPDPATRVLRRAEANAVAVLLGEAARRRVVPAAVRMRPGELLEAAHVGEEELWLVGGCGADLFRHFCLLIRSSAQERGAVGLDGGDSGKVGGRKEGGRRSRGQRDGNGDGARGREDGRGKGQEEEEEVWLDPGWFELARREVEQTEHLLRGVPSVPLPVRNLLDKYVDGGKRGRGRGALGPAGGADGEEGFHVRVFELRVVCELVLKRRPLTVAEAEVLLKVDASRMCDTLLQHQAQGSLLDVRQYGRSTEDEAVRHRRLSFGDGGGGEPTPLPPLLLLGLHPDWAAVAAGRPAARRALGCNMALALSEALARGPAPR